MDAGYYCQQASFENSLWNMEFSTPDIKLLRKNIHDKKKIMDGMLAPLGNKLVSWFLFPFFIF